MDNQFHQMLLERHSIRRYTTQPIDKDAVVQILQAGLLAPSSKSKRPWQFIVVEDPATLEKLAKCKPVAAHPIAKAPMAIVVVADPGLSECYIEDSSIAAVFMQLQAAALGLGSCWIQTRGRYTADNEPSEEYIQNILGIPQYLKVECVLTFGHKDENRRPVDPDKLKWEKVHIGTWKEIPDANA